MQGVGGFFATLQIIPVNDVTALWPDDIAYSFESSEAVPVTTTDTKINEKSAAGYVEYGRQFGKVFVQAGLRYEHLQNDYLGLSAVIA